MHKIFYMLSVLVWIALLYPYPATVFMAGCFACFSFPVYARLESRWPGPKAISLYTAGMLFAISVPISILVLLVVPQAKAGYKMFQQLREANFQLPPHWMEMIDYWKTRLTAIPGFEQWMADLSTTIESTLGQMVRTVVSGGFGVLGSTVGGIWVIFLFLTFSVLGVVYARRFRGMLDVFTCLPADMLDRFILSIRAALRGVFMGILLVALAQGILCGIGFAVAGVPQPAFWGLLATCVAPIPIVGTAIVWLPLCLMLWFSGSMASAIGLAVWGMVAVAGVDNILRPLFLKQGINAPLFVLVLAILCGLSTFGPVGLILGPVLVAFGVQAVREADQLAPSCAVACSNTETMAAPDQSKKNEHEANTKG